MICSISSNSNKHCSNWLDRLRSSRGFPIQDHLDLDHFLTTRSADSPQTATVISSDPVKNNNINDVNNSISNSNDNCPEPDQCVGVGAAATHILSELFNMGDRHENGISRKKGARKQQNPKFCNVKASEDGNDGSSSDELRRDKSENGLASSGGDNCEGKREENDASVLHLEEDEEGSEENAEINKHMKSKVMVIDTSFDEWKAERFFFRRKNVRKGGEKKRNGNNLGGTGKKRKRSTFVVEKERRENSGGLLGLGKEEEYAMPEIPLNQGLTKINDKLQLPSIVAADVSSKVPMNRVPLSRPSKKLKSLSSSVILVKATCTDGARKPGRSSSEKAQNHHNAQ